MLDRICSIDEIKHKITESQTLQNFQYSQDEDDITLYNIEFNTFHIPSVKESIGVDNILRVTLIYEKKSVPLPEWLRKSFRCKLSSFSSLENIVPYIKSVKEDRSLKSEIIEDFFSLETKIFVRDDTICSFTANYLEICL